MHYSGACRYSRIGINTMALGDVANFLVLTPSHAAHTIVYYSFYLFFFVTLGETYTHIVRDRHAYTYAHKRHILPLTHTQTYTHTHTHLYRVLLLYIHYILCSGPCTRRSIARYYTYTHIIIYTRLRYVRVYYYHFLGAI